MTPAKGEFVIEFVSAPLGTLPRPFQLADEESEVAGLNLPPEEPEPTLDGRSGGCCCCCCCVEGIELVLAVVEIGAGDNEGNVD